LTRAAAILLREDLDRPDGVRKMKDGPGTFELFSFLTTEPNAVVAPIHAKGMPVVPMTPAEVETWLTAPWEEAVALQRPLANDLLRIVPKPASLPA
jgi:putative SOS response-associated peptidase YedK